jgi:hypothetical protein
VCDKGIKIVGVRCQESSVRQNLFSGHITLEEYGKNGFGRSRAGKL